MPGPLAGPALDAPRESVNPQFSVLSFVLLYCAGVPSPSTGRQGGGQAGFQFHLGW